MAREYGAGDSLRRIATRHNCSHEHVRRHLRDQGVRLRPRFPQRRTSLPADDLRRLYVDQELSAREIGDLYGVSRSLVYHRLREHGIPRRLSGGRGWEK